MPAYFPFPLLRGKMSQIVGVFSVRGRSLFQDVHHSAKLAALAVFGLALGACDQALNDRYGGLVVAPENEERQIVIVDAPRDAVDLFDGSSSGPQVVQISHPARRPTNVPFSRRLTTQDSAETQAAQTAQATTQATTVETAIESDLTPVLGVDPEAPSALEAVLASTAKPVRRPSSIPYSRNNDVTPQADLEVSPFEGQALIYHRERPDPFPTSFAALEAFTAARQAESEALAQAQAEAAAQAEAETLAAQQAALAAAALEEEARRQAEARAQAEQLAAQRRTEQERAEQEQAARAAAEREAREAALAQQATQQGGEQNTQGAREAGDGSRPRIRESGPLTNQSVFLPLDYSQAETLASSADLRLAYSRAGYDLASVMGGGAVPGLIVQRLPDDLREVGLEDEALMHELFIKAVLPLCLVSNARVLEERAYAIGSGYSGQLAQALDPVLRGLGQKYKAPTMDQLLTHVDAVPASLCLAQAIYDSSWGRSDQAIAQNALFGRWAMAGLDSWQVAPLRGRSDTNGETILFSNLQAATDTYVYFLNSHPDLRDLRTRRAEELAAGILISGRSASVDIGGFRPEEDTYSGIILRAIREFRLDQFDLARLGDTRVPLQVL